MKTKKNVIDVIKIIPKSDLTASGRLGPGTIEIIFKKGEPYYFVSVPRKPNILGICEVKEIYSMNKKELTEASDIQSDFETIYVKSLEDCEDLDEVSKKRLEKLAREWMLYEIEGEEE